MIDAAYCRMMARYNRWQNENLRMVVEPMDDAELRADRGAFFGSILATLNHLLWADAMWLSRFEGSAPPTGGIAGSTTLTPTPAAWGAERFRLDGRLIRWAERLRAVELAGDLTWHSGALGREVTKPLAFCVVHMFNHQTHHRGQVHAMLTAAGQSPGVTDLFLMPDAG
ncbi:MAG: damage-inducible protein DinB [Limimaricola sp.]|uniref:DinB family protein n=1 Tax=Limimaricola sp. TaxID=2211665 RepID=UPI001D94E8C1|nr:DinB family protein [Limimaricola sp.]MBI1416870.1 damage-inducible protein DinB [Limimaricola sp.]